MKDDHFTTAMAAQTLQLTDGRIRQICRWNRIGRKVGRDWILTSREVAKIAASKNRRKTD